jgi:hypothetical protein
MLSSHATPTSFSALVMAGHTSRRYRSVGRQEQSARRRRYAGGNPACLSQQARGSAEGATGLQPLGIVARTGRAPRYLGNRMAKELSSSRPVGLSSLLNFGTAQWSMPSWSHGLGLSCCAPCHGPQRAGATRSTAHSLAQCAGRAPCPCACQAARPDHPGRTCWAPARQSRRSACSLTRSPLLRQECRLLTACLATRVASAWSLNNFFVRPVEPRPPVQVLPRV